ncbi:glycoside hydrolase family 28 protein [Sphingomonas psychrotolerans]|uniref:Glycoside hydrolase family 28 protein n=1 Tax=Sphingomonas psychrotolerans TaxID=1327635 RepID=A0ABU3N997_9SPHN|nr:glycosyl hydrolase family 28-related protein [Sphingomonas psychrotolerans]MDT8761074.1 glycoside hydrolase family 28 protein [Sphingomonas psychrotolerans]
MRTGHVFDVRDHGARGNGVVLDSPAINAAILAAEKAGGGMVVLPPGDYLSFSIRLKSRVTLVLEAGATLIAAEKGPLGQYDLPEDRGPQLYQDFGHSHWHNSLIWAEHAEDIAIIGKGRILGLGLTRNGQGTPWSKQAGERPLSMAGMPVADIGKLERSRDAMRGMGNKAIALAHCKRVKLDGFTIFKGGHFALLASEVDGLDIRHLAVDTNRDGLDLDCVRRARVEHCRVNSPNDDAIVLKTSLALGRRSNCEDIEIRDCTVSGYDLGTMLDGTRRKTQELAPDRDRVTGRIKIGTESNGDFRRIRIANCRFERSRGLAIETVDGGTVEDVLAENIVMDDVTTAPLFLRLGARLRGPEGTTPGAMRNVEVRGLAATGIDPRFAAVLAGLPDHPIECVQLRDIDLHFRGGFSEPVPAQPPELADAYPEPSMFGPTPAWGVWVRHVTGLEVKRLRLSRDGSDPRPPVQLDDAHARAEDAQYWPDAV